MVLIDMRGSRQFENELGRLLFFKFRSQLMSSCLQRSVPLPDHVAGWMRKACSERVYDCSKYTESLTDLAIGVSAITPTSCVIKLCSLRAAVAEQTITDAREIKATAQEIESELCRMLSQYDNVVSKYRTVTTSTNSDGVFQGRLEIHEDCAGAQAWNQLRNTSILANSMIIEQCERLRALDSCGISAEEEVLAWHARVTIQKLCRDVCSSVPYMLGTLPDDVHVTPPRTPEVADALAVLWPLFSCARTDCVSADLRQWTRGRLLYINHIFGIRQAGLMVEVIDREM